MGGIAVTNFLLAIIAAVLIFGREAVTSSFSTLAIVALAVLVFYFLLWLIWHMLTIVWSAFAAGVDFARTPRSYRELARDAVKGLLTIYAAPIIYPIRERRFRQTEGAGTVVTTLSMMWTAIVGLLVTGLVGIAIPFAIIRGIAGL